jgi:thioesterase domain-containing protein
MHDDFFALGGHSLLTIKLLREIEKQTKQRLTIASIFEGPTIERVATLLEKGGTADQTEAASVLMPIKTTGNRPPLFCIDGEPTRMAGSVHPDQPIYSLYHAYDQDFVPPDTLQELATLYIKEIKRIQPAGPYHIVGFCIGGLVGYEITRQLLSNGEEVGYLAMIDPTIPGRRGESRAAWVKHSFSESSNLLRTSLFFFTRAFASLYARAGYTQRLARGWIYRKLGLELPLRLRHIRNAGKIRASHHGYQYREIQQAATVFLVDLSEEDFQLNREFWDSVFLSGTNVQKIEGLHHHTEFLTEPYISNVTRIIDSELPS